ncbi:MAG: Crp/Fnr family transcriptional regulator [Loktanella salsilacus]
MDWQPTKHCVTPAQLLREYLTFYIRRLLTKAYCSATEFSGASLNMSFDRTPLMRRLGGAVPEEELELFDSLGRVGKKYAIGHDLGEECRADESIMILQHGWTMTYKILRGGDRQVIDVNLPGDVLGMRQILFNYDDYRIEPITEVFAQKLPADIILRSLGKSPEIAAQVMWAMMSDSAFSPERLVSMGRREAPKRVAHFLLELGARLDRVHLSNKNGYLCPLSQTDLGDILGMSAVHVNRVLRDLRERDLLTFRIGKVKFHDREELNRYAEFEPSYMERRLH